MSLKSSSSAAKRIMTEMKEMQVDDSSEFTAAPLEENIFEWHFTLRGPVDSPFAEGLYHGRILLPTDYPFSAPHIVFLTPNGRWKVDTKVCITFTGFHEESWQPAWGATRQVPEPYRNRTKIARLSRSSTYTSPDPRSVHWTCPQCQQSNAEILQDRPRQRVDTAAMLPGVPKATQNENERGPAQPEPQDTTRASEHASTPPDEVRGEEPVNDEPPVQQETRPPTPATMLERPSFPAPELSLVSTALGRQELSVLQARIESCRRIVLLLDSLMGLVSGLLVLLILKNL